MRSIVIVPLMLLLSAGATAAQQRGTPSADETQIRDLIAKYDKGESVPRTSDVVFWSGAFKRPTVGPERGEEVPNGRQPSLRVPGSQRNRTTPIRIEIAASRDLAYEYSNSVLTFDLKSGTKQEVQTSVLRVWKKDGGQWKIAALFARPHEAP